ncbi:hypothetical protein V502_00083 [Pseudogymnoascus sp. VKM F-4520 (FW-2644)]|nr:hypothetical protein V502_00083 [Pseudogymnoascus sp. VKM F-4520 (FW-2644)]
MERIWGRVWGMGWGNAWENCTDSPVATPNTNFSSTLLPPKTPSTANRTRQTDTLPAAADRVWGLADRHQNPVSRVSRVSPVSPVSPLKSLLVVPVTRPERPYLR